MGVVVSRASMEEPGQPEDPPPPGRQSGSARAEFVDAGRLLPESAMRWLRDRAAEALARLDASGSVRVRLLDDAAMALQHERYKGVAGTTDVLTFDLRDDATGPLDVDVLVCVDEANRQAAKLGHAPERELLLYVVHGVLHCMGHDDHDESAAELMHRREDEILDAIGVGTTYHRIERDHLE